MTIKANLTVLCDGECRPYEPKAGYCSSRCRVPVEGNVLREGVIQTTVPPGWTLAEGRSFGPTCSERRAMAKVMQAEVPDPEQDPPILKPLREQSVEIMREVIKEDLEGKSDLDSKIRELRAQIAVLSDTSDPDFAGSFSGGARDTVEVRVRADVVEISWPYSVKGLTSITVRHENLVLLDPPPFLDEKLVSWINGCLRTMEGDRLPADDRLAH